MHLVERALVSGRERPETFDQIAEHVLFFVFFIF